MSGWVSLSRAIAHPSLFGQTRRTTYVEDDRLPVLHDRQRLPHVFDRPYRVGAIFQAM